MHRVLMLIDITEHMEHPAANATGSGIKKIKRNPNELLKSVCHRMHGIYYTCTVRWNVNLRKKKR